MLSAAPQRQQLEQSLREFHLPTVREWYEQQARQAQQESLSYEEYLLELMERELERRRQNRIAGLLRESKAAAGEELEDVPPQAAAEEGGFTARCPGGGLVCRALREGACVSESRHWENALVMCHRTGAD